MKIFLEVLIVIYIIAAVKQIKFNRNIRKEIQEIKNKLDIR